MNKMNDLTILHLSDLHIDEAKGRPNILLENLLNDIRFEMKYSDNILIVVTGDLVNQANYKNKSRVISFFRKLKKYLPDKIKNIYIVPGNHDKVRSNIDEMILRTSEFDKSNDQEIQWKYVKTAFDEYLDLVENIYKIFYGKRARERVLIDTFGVNIDNVGGKNICVIQFNTAWMSEGDHDQRNLKIGEFQFKKIKDDFADEYEKLGNEKIDLTIALAHHPVNWLTGSEEDKIQQEMLSPNGLNASIYICGHTHNRDVINWQNNRNSLTTLVSGLGWPDGSTSHPYAHTYSSYVFNLDVNSIDVYVRSSNDAYTFEPDFRIYTNERNKKSKKIVLPIDICKTQSYFNLNVPSNRSAKACFITERIIKDLKKYSQIFTMCEDKLRDKLETIKYDTFDEICEHCDDGSVLNMLNNAWFYNEDINVSCLEEKIRNIFMDHFTNYLEAICKILYDTVIHQFPKVSIRIHFRCLDIEADSYYQIALFGQCEDGYKMESLSWGQLIEKAYINRCPLVASVNKRYCTSSFEKNDKKSSNKWKDFITAVPAFGGNVYIKREALTEDIIIERPYLSFGATVYHEQDRMILYMFDYYQIDWFIGRQILKFLKYFPMNMDEYVEHLKLKRGNKNEQL